MSLQQGRSAEYYRTHHVPIPHKLNQQYRASKKLRSKSEPPPQNNRRKLPGTNNSKTEVTVRIIKKNSKTFQSPPQNKKLNGSARRFHKPAII